MLSLNIHQLGSYFLCECRQTSVHAYSCHSGLLDYGDEQVTCLVSQRCTPATYTYTSVHAICHGKSFSLLATLQDCSKSLYTFKWRLKALICGTMTTIWHYRGILATLASLYTSGSAMAEGPRDALVSRNSATTKHPI